MARSRLYAAVEELLAEPSANRADVVLKLDAMERMLGRRPLPDMTVAFHLLPKWSRVLEADARRFGISLPPHWEAAGEAFFSLPDETSPGLSGGSLGWRSMPVAKSKLLAGPDVSIGGSPSLFRIFRKKLND